MVKLVKTLVVSLTMVMVDAGIVAELTMLLEELLAAELLGDLTTVTDTVVGVAECGGKDVVIVA